MEITASGAGRGAFTASPGRLTASRVGPGPGRSASLQALDDSDALGARRLHQALDDASGSDAALDPATRYTKYGWTVLTRPWTPPRRHRPPRLTGAVRFVQPVQALRLVQPVRLVHVFYSPYTLYALYSLHVLCTFCTACTSCTSCTACTSCVRLVQPVRLVYVLYSLYVLYAPRRRRALRPLSRRTEPRHHVAVSSRACEAVSSRCARMYLDASRCGRTHLDASRCRRRTRTHGIHAWDTCLWDARDTCAVQGHMLYSPYTLYRDTCCTAHTRILYIVGHMLMGCVGHVRYLRLWDTCAGLLGLD
jgi:hypothetical protein